MARPAGARNRDFEDKRAALLNVLTNFALNADLRRPSLRQFAIAAGASEPTLRHYFKDRQGVVVAIFETIGARGRQLWDAVAAPSESPAQAVEEYFRVSEAGMRHGGFSRAHAFGLIEGLADEAAAEAYRTHVLEPALDTIARKAAGTPGAPADLRGRRAFAFALFAPLLVLSLHQELLGGAESAPFSVSDLTTHLRRWLGAGLAATG